MKASVIRSFLVLCLMALASSISLAADADIAPKLIGKWEGKWIFGSAGGKLTAEITAVEGTKLKGEAAWFGTAAGDLKLPFGSAEIKDGTVKIEQMYNLRITGKVSEDAKSMTGTWESAAADGPMELKKID